VRCLVPEETKLRPDLDDVSRIVTPRIGSAPARQQSRRKVARAKTMGGVLLAVLLVGSSVDVSSATTLARSSAAPSSVVLGDRTTAYDGKLRDGWVDLGWGPRTLNQGPAKVDVGDWQGWILARPTADLAAFETLSIQVRIPPGQQQPLALVRAGNESDTNFPAYRFGKSAVDAKGWATYSVPVKSLTPGDKPFDRLLFGAARQVSGGTFVEFDKIVLSGRRTRNASSTVPVSTSRRVSPPRAARISLDCAADRKEISKAVYGIAFNALTEESQQAQFTMGATSRRWGGDPTSRFNWENGNAWNPGHNWYWRNLKVLNNGNAWQTFLANNAKAKMSSALTIPMLGWVAKDTTSYSFPVSTRGKQQDVAPDLTDAGNGVSAAGEILKPSAPTQTSKQSTAPWVAKWITTIRNGGWTDTTPLEMVILDNEPDLWNASHRDIRTEPSTYDELLSKGVEYATAVRKVDPQVKIAGPASWGWWGYFYSAADAKAGFSAKPDRRAHGDQPFLEWYLAEMKKAEIASGLRLLDILDIHYYPANAGVFSVTGGNTDPTTNETRVRSTRSLWDPTYKDETWVDASVYLLPRMQDTIAKFKPGIGLSIGEYNFGGETHMSGAVAQAEALGRFGQYGVTSAYLWTHPKENTEQYWGFRSFRNYDGKGSNFGQFSVKAAITGAGTRELSAFGSADAFTKQKTVVLVNRSSTVPYRATIQPTRCGSGTTLRQWTYGGGPKGFVEQAQQVPRAGSFEVSVDPWTITVLRIE
jgi:hypothetical protein